MLNLKKIEKILTAVAVVLFLVSTVYRIVGMLLHQNEVVCLIIVLAIYVFAAAIAIVFTVLIKKRKVFLRAKYFGVVNESDVETSKKLLERVSCIETGNYGFLEQEEYFVDAKTTREILIGLSKGNKADEESVQLFFDIRKLIDDSPFKDDSSNVKFNEFINDLCLLLENNKCPY